MSVEIYSGMIRNGKSYIVTEAEQKKLIHGGVVYSNYPIIFEHRKKIYSSLVWDDKFVYEPIRGSDIVLDEAYRTVSSMNWKDYDTDQHTFYATSGHNSNQIKLIVQAIPRILKAIREITEKYHDVRKISIPWIKKSPEGYYDKPLYFKETIRLASDLRVGEPAKEVYAIIRHPFRMSVANAYNTHQYRTTADLSFEPEFWIRKINPPKTKFVEDWYQEVMKNVTT